MIVYTVYSYREILHDVEGLMCPRDPRGYVVGGLFSPGRVTHGKLVLGEGPDKEPKEHLEHRGNGSHGPE